MKIVIAGERGEGKTTIAKIIVRALEDAGIEIEKTNDGDAVTDLHQEERIRSLRKDLKIELETINIVKPGYDSRDVKNSRPAYVTASGK